MENFAISNATLNRLCPHCADFVLLRSRAAWSLDRAGGTLNDIITIGPPKFYDLPLVLHDIVHQNAANSSKAGQDFSIHVRQPKRITGIYD